MSLTLWIILGVVVVALVVLLILFFRKKKQEKAALAPTTDAEAPGGSEIEVLVHEAEGKLAAAKLPGAKAANLPVYLILGDPGTTKTSIVMHSGLEPELVAGQVYQGGNVCSTRTANLWFSRRSLFVEAGGALLTDPGRWRTLIKKLRPRAGVVTRGEQAGRAAVVCFDSENFAKSGSMDLAVNAARNLRAKLGEISQAMGINLPVYVLFTRVDRLPYFTEYVRNLNTEEASQVVGVTLPMLDRRSEGVYAEEETSRLTWQFERLFQSLADARPEFLARELDPTRLPAAYEFPREFRKIRPALVQFLVDLCRPSQLTVGPFLRGFYFTGVRPIVINDSAPVAPAQAPQQQFATPAGATGIFQLRKDAGSEPSLQPSPRPAQVTRKVPQWLFLSHLFNDVLLADRAAMGASGASTRTSKGRRILFIAAAALCLLLTVGFTISFFKNHGVESRVWSAVKAIPAGDVPATEFAPVASLRKLDDLRAELYTLMTWRDGPPFFYKWGLYAGDEVYRNAKPVYCDKFRQQLLKQTQDNMLGYLRMAPSSNAEYRQAYEALRAYLITTAHPEKSDAQLPPALMRFWLYNRTADSERQTLARNQFDFYQQDLLISPACTATPDTAVVASAQAYLKRLGATRRVYQSMLDEANRKFQPVNFNRTYPGSERTVLDSYDVPGAFTTQGWQFMNDAIAHPDRYVKGEAWVLGEESSASIDLGKISGEIKPLYVADFLKEWRSYLAAGRVQRYADWSDAAAKLDVLDSNQSTLLELIFLASQHTAVEDDTIKRAFQPVQYTVPPSSKDHLIVNPNQPYMGALSQLQLAALGMAKQPNDTAAAGAAQNAATQARGVAKSLGQGFSPEPEGHVDQQVQRLLEEPIKWAEALFIPDSAKLNKKGQEMCRMIDPVLEKYPFSGKKNAPKATLQEIDEKFKPNGGQLWGFIDDNFKEIKHQGLHFEAGGTSGPPINPGFLDWLNRVGRFAEAAYKGGSNTAHLTYSVKPVSAPEIEGISLNIDGDGASFTQSAANPHQFTWPGNSQGVRLTVKFRGGQNRPFPFYEGLWGVFEWVADADHRNGSTIEIIEGAGVPKKYTINPDTNQPFAVKFDLNADPPVFNPGYFTFGCVAKVAK